MSRRRLRTNKQRRGERAKSRKSPRRNQSEAPKPNTVPRFPPPSRGKKRASSIVYYTSRVNSVLARFWLSTDSSEKQFCMNCGKEMRYSWEAKKWICDECQLSREAPAPPPPPPRPKEKPTLSAIATGLAVVGFALIGGIYLEIPAVVIALVALYRGERRGSWIALLVSVACLVTTLFLVLVSQSPLR
jgi:ribosomal protein L37AE/L43A